ncbi:hypothetical protein Cni_G28802 [Canna indica]|uniref:Fucosyltransferase n=1 Tax=Canna indica TaxID=4628 RepID=A0AAQ3L4L7_9LILI|nr:hypothetical protein Cni_G28802 [Canna indica]
MEAITGTEPKRGYHSLEMEEMAMARNGSRARRRWTTAVACLVFVPLSVFVLGRAYGRPSFEWMQAFGARNGEGSSSTLSDPTKDKLLGGLLSPQFDASSCLSRYQSASYRKASPHPPSPYLLQRLRSYEALHRRCAPGTELYRKSVEQLKSNKRTAPMECNYIVWIPHYGLGNRIVSLVSSFFFALLNSRVLLVHVPAELADLFCEPFPEASWVLPSDFPIKNLEKFDSDSPQSYGNMLRNKVIDNGMRFSANATLPAYAYLHLPWYYKEWDKVFFCEDGQQMLRKFPWLLLKSDHYFVPALFLVEEYEAELRRLFPERTTVFHHLVRYLIHPSNTVWGHVTRYYSANLAKADERIGIQVRNLKQEPVPFEFLLGQIVNCSVHERILPSILSAQKKPRAPVSGAKVKAVFITSLDSRYSERVRDMYKEHPTATGELVRVYQASHEVEQRTEERQHNAKALAEMVLLSFSDVLVTTACSTFGYVAQGLSGVRPLVLMKPWKSSLPCRWAESAEPCFLIPPRGVCDKHSGFDKGMAKHVRQCEDENEGIKLFD